ncbi:hypothetical protein JMUB5695_00781 [Mycobacterium heckeshornense]|uniref:hypothetical protein n=1 Tax=Mycobacterium heckeshornense TaxID=110505 RepID=UPI00194212F4|nr:hypothetical protein [Mycobacterium heckeshornense]BCQ07360.1 hypothetical protein JMUB5695_00781 [Mycobacterium heckeshornense]
MLTENVERQISWCYKSSRIEQYFNGHRAQLTETVSSANRVFGIGRREIAENWKPYGAVGDCGIHKSV